MTGTSQFEDVQGEKLLACIDLLRRTGLHSFQLRYHDDEQPVVWMAVGEWKVGPDRTPAPDGADTYFEASASLRPELAALRLVERMVDGSECQHCRRPAGVSTDWQNPQPLAPLVCWYVYDPELKTFRRSCEGS